MDAEDHFYTLGMASRRVCEPFYGECDDLENTNQHILPFFFCHLEITTTFDIAFRRVASEFYDPGGEFDKASGP